MPEEYLNIIARIRNAQLKGEKFYCVKLEDISPEVAAQVVKFGGYRSTIDPKKMEIIFY